MMRTRVSAAPHSCPEQCGCAPDLYMSSIISGKEDIAPSIASQLMEEVEPTKTRTGADSPITRATASMMPVTMPEGRSAERFAQWSSTLERPGRRGLTQVHWDHTEHFLGVADDDWNHQQNQRKCHSHTGALEAEEVIHIAKTNSAATMEGTPERMSTMKVVRRLSRPPREYSTR